MASSDRRQRLRSALIELDGAGNRERAPPRTWRGPVASYYAILERYEIDGVEYVIARRRPPDEVAARLLSARERQVLERLAQGESNKEIAFSLGVTASTVGVLLWRAAAKLGATSREQLIRFWSDVYKPL